MSETNEPPATVSISWRLQRTTTEVAYVSVLVTEDLLVEQPDGSRRINVEEMVRRAIAMGESSEAVWELESQEVKPHPIQMAPPNIKNGPGGAS